MASGGRTEYNTEYSFHSIVLQMNETVPTKFCYIQIQLTNNMGIYCTKYDQTIKQKMKEKKTKINVL